MKISFLDIVSWIVVRSSTKIIYSSSFGEMVRMGTGPVQIVLDLIWRKKKEKKIRKNEKKTTQNQYKTKRNGSVQLVSHLILRLNYAPPDASLTPGMSS